MDLTLEERIDRAETLQRELDSLKSVDEDDRAAMAFQREAARRRSRVLTALMGRPVPEWRREDRHVSRLARVMRGDPNVTIPAD